jgi:biotin operon repressor/predicted phosphodiesterase
MKKQQGEINLTDLAPKVSPLRQKVLGLLSKKSKSRQRVSLVDVANLAECSPKQAQYEIEALNSDGYNIEFDAGRGIELSQTIPKKDSLVIKTDDYFGDDWVRFGFIADTHLVSKYSRLDVLNAIYDVYEREGISTVYHGGNWIDGECRFNKYDLHCVGFDSQLNYFLKNYPKRKNITTNIVSGDDHEGWYVQREKINVGQVMQDRAEKIGRNDLIDLGYMERDIEFKRGNGKSTVRIIHAGGGSAYAISYTSQKYVEMLQGGEKPSMVLVGHFHKFDWAYPREVHVVQGGTTCDQTPFMRKKRLQAMVGACIIEAKQDRRGIFNRVRVEWMPFYDKSFYKYQW